MAPTQLGAFARSRPDARDAQPRVPRPAAVARPVRRRRCTRFPAFTASVCNLRPDAAAARVHVRSADPLRQRPRSRRNYLSTDGRPPRRRRRDLRLTRRIVAQPRRSRATRREELQARRRDRRATTSWRARPATSARRSSTRSAPAGWAGDDPVASSTPSCACAASRGLRVVDASVMPTITSGNTNAPTIMIAEKASRSRSAPSGARAVPRAARCRRHGRPWPRTRSPPAPRANGPRSRMPPRATVARRRRA